MIKSVCKGQLEYIKNKKWQRGLISLSGLAIVAAIFLTGYLTTGTRENILTVAAILTVLPTAKFIVSFFLLLPHHSQTREAYEEGKALAGPAIFYTDVLISTEKKVQPVDFAVIRANSICCYTSHPKCDAAGLQEYLAAMYKRNGLKPNIKIFTDKSRFLMRTKELASMETDEKQTERDGRIAALLLTLVL